MSQVEGHSVIDQAQEELIPQPALARGLIRMTNYCFYKGMVMSVVKRRFEQPDAEVGSVGWFVCPNTDPLLIWSVRPIRNASMHR